MSHVKSQHTCLSQYTNGIQNPVSRVLNFHSPPVAVVSLQPSSKELHKIMFLMSCYKTITKITIMKNKVHGSKYILPKELALS